MKRLVHFGLILFLVLQAGCTSVYNPATGRQESLMISTAREVEIGRSAARKVETIFELSDDPAHIALVESIGEEVVAVCERKDLRYHFRVIDDEELNAFALPGGYVYIHSGMIEKAGSNDEIAVVIAHELGHVGARHSVKQMQAAFGYNIGMTIIAMAAGGESSDFLRAVNMGFDLAMRGYSRQDELEADRIGLRYVYKAGYNPRAMVTLLHRIQQEKSHSQIFSAWSTHPALPDRIEQAKIEIAKYPPRASYNERPDIDIMPDTEPQIKGEFKFCPECGRRYEEKYNFCPRDNTELKWGRDYKP